MSQIQVKFVSMLRRWVWLSVLVVALDQLSKLWVDGSMNLYESIPVMPFFHLTYVRNLGAAFSFLGDAGGWQRWFFVALSSVASIGITLWISRLSRHEYWLGAALALILGGAVGNLIDRVAYGYVIDFLDVFYQTHHWPTFNLADSAITVGAVIMLLDSFRQQGEEDGEPLSTIKH